MALPDSVGFGTVRGTFMRAVADGPDADRYPDGIPLSDLTLIFKADLKPNAVVKTRNVTPAKTIIIDPIEAKTNSAGVLIGPDGNPDILLLATNDPDIDPTGWTWSVEIKSTSFKLPAFSFMLPEGTIVDLSTVVPVPANPGSSMAEWQAVVATVLAARDDVVRAVPAGGAQGQVLTKKSSTSFDSEWTNASGGVSEAQLNAGLAGKANTTHTHTATQVSDSTAVGRSVMTAVDAAAARSAIGAGTGNGTSNLALGTTSTTAAAGDAVVRLTGAQTVAGVKTFSSAPVVPDDSFSVASTVGLQTALDSTVKTTGAQTIAGTKSFTSAPTVPDGSFSIAKTTGLQAAIDDKLGSSNATVNNIVIVSSLPTTGVAKTLYLRPVN